MHLSLEALKAWLNPRKKSRMISLGGKKGRKRDEEIYFVNKERKGASSTEQD